MTTKKSASLPDTPVAPMVPVKVTAKKTPAKKIAALTPVPVTAIPAKTGAKKDVQKLQRAVVDGLEAVKAHEIVVFDTEHLSPLFERVVIASGTSNRQTKALAASVVDAVREAGFGKPRVEGEGNGEWIIVDCGQAVVHVMQPTFRTYYNLEELWGDKPVRLKLGATKPVRTGIDQPVADVKGSAKTGSSLRRSSAAKKGVEEAFPSKAQLKKAAQSKENASKSRAIKPMGISADGKKDAKTVAKPKVRTLVVNAPAKAAAKKTGVRSAAKTTTVRKATARKA